MTLVIPALRAHLVSVAASYCMKKGMDFQIIDVDIHNKPEDLAVMNPYNQVPVLVERDLILHEANIINEYIDERFPHRQADAQLTR